MTAVSRRTVVLAAVALGLATVAVAAGTWVTATAPGIDHPVVLAVPGTAAVPGVVAGGLVTAAAGLALSLGGAWVRRLGAVVLAGAGVLVAWTALALVRDPLPTAQAAARRELGVAVVDAAAVAPLAWVGAGLGVATVVVALVAARGRWGTTSRRYAPGAEAGPPDASDDWDALTRGEDPS